MVKSEYLLLEKRIGQFKADYVFNLRTMIAALDEAGISHYSSGCNNKRLTFDLFPASDYVRELMGMLSMDRPYKGEMFNGFKDAASNTEYNPAHMFVQYLRRWSLFAEQIMQSEGDSDRGVAAARAHLIMADLLQNLTAYPVDDKSRNSKKVVPHETRTFFVLMRSIGLALEAREQQQKLALEVREKAERDHNTRKAMQAAQAKLSNYINLKPLSASAS